MKHKSLTVFFAGIAGLAAMSAIAGMSIEDATPKPSGDAVEAASALALADQLAEYGDRTGDPIALVVAAKIKKENSLAAREGSPTTEGSGDSAEPPSFDGRSAADLLSRARALAADQSDVLGLISDVESLAVRGDIQGAGCYPDQIVDAGYTQTWSITYTPGNNWASISGDGDTDLDLYIYSGDGRVICRSEGLRDSESCSWRQSQTGTIRVAVENLGGVWNQYRFCTN